jgi:cation diffusion facilitator family transporter
MPSASERTVWVALAADLGVGLAKVGAAVFTGSPAMASEASHALTDTANDFFLLVARRRSSHAPDDLHPLGYGREAYFWALIAALGVFLAGAAFSLRAGIVELIDPVRASSFTVAYVVLGISAVFDLISLHQSVNQMTFLARSANRDLLEQSRVSSDPTLRAVLLQDAVSISGDVVTFAGLALNQVTGSSAYQGVAAVLIGLALIRASLRLVRRNHDFLVGQPITPPDKERVRTVLLGYSGVTAVRELIVTFIGPNQIWVIARVDIDNHLCGDQITSLVGGVETALQLQSKDIFRVDVVPTGATVLAGAPIVNRWEGAEDVDRAG